MVQILTIDELEEEIAFLREQIHNLIGELGECNDEKERILEHNRQFQDPLATSVEQLITYGQHHTHCNPEHGCSCGWDTALRLARHTLYKSRQKASYFFSKN